MERVLERDDPLAPGRDPRDLHRVLDGLGAAVREHALGRDGVPLGPGEDAVELLRQAHVRLVRDGLRAHVCVFPELLLHRGDDVGMLVSEVQRADACDEIEVALPLRVEDLRALRPRDDDRRADVKPLRHIALAKGSDLLARDLLSCSCERHPATPIRSSMRARSS